MKFILLLALTTVAFAAKLGDLEGIEQFSKASESFVHKDVEVISHVQEPPVGANYNHAYELKNGVSVKETGSEGSVGQSIATGSFKFITPEGNTIEVFYTADENGFRAESDAIPQPPPLPSHVEEQLAIAERQRAEGIQFDERGFQI